MADYLADVIFLVNALGLFSNDLKKIFPGIDTGLYRKKMWRKLQFVPDKYVKGFDQYIVFHQTEKDSW